MEWKVQKLGDNGRWKTLYRLEPGERDKASRILQRCYDHGMKHELFRKILS